MALASPAFIGPGQLRAHSAAGIDDCRIERTARPNRRGAHGARRIPKDLTARCVASPRASASRTNSCWWSSLPCRPGRGKVRLRCRCRWRECRLPATSCGLQLAPLDRNAANGLDSSGSGRHRSAVSAARPSDVRDAAAMVQRLVPARSPSRTAYRTSPEAALRAECEGGQIRSGGCAGVLSWTTFFPSFPQVPWVSRYLGYHG